MKPPLLPASMSIGDDRSDQLAPRPCGACPARCPSPRPIHSLRGMSTNRPVRFSSWTASATSFLVSSKARTGCTTELGVVPAFYLMLPYDQDGMGGEAVDE